MGYMVAEVTGTGPVTAVPIDPERIDPERIYPARFRAAPERSARLARRLRLVAGVRSLDEELMDRIGRRMFARDEPAAELVRAMRRDVPAAERVSMAQVGHALEGGSAAVPDAPPALRRFLDLVEPTPGWVDFDLVERGARAFRRMGRSRADVLLQLSLIGGYQFGGPADLLVETGGLTGDTAMRRLGETQKWAMAVSRPGGMGRDGEGWRLTVHVRLMHALINQRFEGNGRWDTARWGLPINQSDQAGTLGLFNATLLLGMRALGWVVTPAESRAVMHLWKYVGWLMGVDEEWLFDTEREQNAFMCHVLSAQGELTPAGVALTGALVDGQLTLDRGPLSELRGHYARLRLLSMLRYFLRKRAVRDFRLPVTPPWAVPPIVARNLVASAVVSRVPAGRRYLERKADRVDEVELGRYFGGATPRIGALPGGSG
jgi:hypothetical protein